MSSTLSLLNWRPLRPINPLTHRDDDHRDEGKVTGTTRSHEKRAKSSSSRDLWYPDRTTRGSLLLDQWIDCFDQVALDYW
jgi:hypothetical protein